MPNLIVVQNPKDWTIELPDVEIVAARQYLTDPTYSQLKRTRVFNLCRSYAYQSIGYYVSLLAEARGHRPRPDVVTIQDMKSISLARVRADDLEDLMQRTLRSVKHETFQLSIYFGRTLAKRDQALGNRLFGMFPCPLLRAGFIKKRNEWQLQSVRPIPAGDIPDNHFQSVLAAAERYFQKREWSGPVEEPPRYWLAMLVDPEEKTPPSDARALKKFITAANRLDMGVETITKDDFGRVGEFDALFIRTTTAVNHYTYRFARRAASEGLAVIDDPVSIVRCANKVYLAERMALKGISTPRSMIVHRDNIEEAVESLGLPVVLKRPDSAFSLGVKKAETIEDYRLKVAAMLEDSDLIVAQEYLPTDFDWRVGVLNGQPLYVCKYHMAGGHWQIIQHRDDNKKALEGESETLRPEDAPKKVVSTAVAATRLIGDGLYGVDLKQVGKAIYVIEVNDNPNLDAGYEDAILKDQLYLRVIEHLINTIEKQRTARPRRRTRQR